MTIFIITSATGMAQEGIDLHNYCHQIMHWDFGIDPVSFEQKCGRINRRLGHLIRKRMAAYSKKHKIEPDQGETRWECLVENIKKNKENEYSRNKGLFLEWYFYDEDDKYGLRQIMIGYPLNSREKTIYEYLRYQLGLYRIASGLDVEMEKEKIYWSLFPAKTTSMQLKR